MCAMRPLEFSIGKSITFTSFLLLFFHKPLFHYFQIFVNINNTMFPTAFTAKIIYGTFLRNVPFLKTDISPFRFINSRL